MLFLPYTMIAAGIALLMIVVSTPTPPGAP
jgi:hypothetical protein